MEKSGIKCLKKELSSFAYKCDLAGEEILYQPVDTPHLTVSPGPPPARGPLPRWRGDKLVRGLPSGRG